MTDYSHAVVKKCPDCGTLSSSADGPECDCHQENCEHRWKRDKEREIEVVLGRYVKVPVWCKYCYKEGEQKYILEEG